jgi:hypothetical protein
MTHETIVNVEYKHRDGWHVFTSPDLHGLYIASQDPKAAYDDVPVAIQALIELDYSCRCTVTRALPFEEFAELTLHGDGESSSAPELRSEALTVRGCRDEFSPGPN